MTWLLFAEAAVPEGGLFDLDATLPLMALQVVLLTFLLNSLFFRPVGKVVEDREGYINTSRADAKQSLSKFVVSRPTFKINFEALDRLRSQPLLKQKRKLTLFTARR